MQLSGDRHKPRHKPRWCMERWAHSTGFYWLQLIPWRIDEFLCGTLEMAFFNGLVLDEPDACTKDCINLYVTAAETPNSLVQFDGHGSAPVIQTDINKWCAILWQATEPWLVFRCLCLGKKRQLTVKSCNLLITETPSRKFNGKHGDPFLLLRRGIVY